jgi:hypothetical protein
MSRRSKVEFGDFQTPIELAADVCALIAGRGFKPGSVLEPSCGQGAFLRASIEQFPSAGQFLGIEVNASYLADAKQAVNGLSRSANVSVRCGDFFNVDWNAEVGKLPEPILILGNPPWVTNSTLGRYDSLNVPTKSNAERLSGIDALTGKSNFDISEWMLRRNLQSLSGRAGMLAVLCKTAVARKVLLFCWNNDIRLRSSEIRRVDAKKHFDASVDACLLIIETDSCSDSRECADYASLTAREPLRTIGIRDKLLVADVGSYDRWLHLKTSPSKGWRSGIKHDCSRVFELRSRSGRYENGFGDIVELESEVVFPLLKSSDVAADRQPRRWILIPHSSMTDSPEKLRTQAPKAWQYLVAHDGHLSARRSSIYRNRSPYSIFGVGDYSFSHWKAAISGMYKKLDFVPISPIDNRPVLLDDTTYQFACESREDRDLLVGMINSEIATEFLSARVFWDSKRPITAALLNSLDLGLLAKELGYGERSVRRAIRLQKSGYKKENSAQELLFSD